MDKYLLPRREREKNKHKEEILEAALRLFSEKGFHNVSMQEIAEKSEFGVGTIYNFFESKEALFEELMKNSAEQTIREFSEILDGPGSEKERLSAFIRQLPEFQEKHGELIKLYISEYGIKGLKLSKIRDESKSHEAINSKLAQLVEQGINKGLFRPVDPAITAKSLASIIETLIFETTGRFDRNNVTQMFNKVEQLFLDGLLLPGGQTNE